MHTTVINGDFKCIQKLLNEGFDINEQDYSGNNLLHIAIENNRTDIFKFLMEKNLDIELANSQKCTPLHKAAGVTGEYTELLLKKGVKVNLLDVYENTALHYAITSKNVHAIKLLLANGANVNAKNKNGNTSIDLANAMGNVEIIDLIHACNN